MSAPPRRRPPAQPSYDIVHLAHTDFPADPRVRREAMVAAEGGARVAVIALRGARGAKPVERYRGVTVIRVPGTKRRGGFAAYLADYAEFVWRAYHLIRRTPRLRGAQVVHVHTLPDFLVAAAAPAAARGARTVLDLHEIFPEFVRAKFGGALGASAGAVADFLERWSRRRADVTITVNWPIEALLRSRPARRGERIEVVHNVADPADFGQAGLTTGVVEGTVRLVYHGTLTSLYGLDLAVDAVASARRAGHAVTFDIYGDGPLRPALAEQVVRLDVSDAVRLHGSVDARTLRRELPTFHAGLVPTRLDEMTRYSLSTKLLEYVHLGIPLIAPRIPTYERYFPDLCAWYFAPNDPADAARAIGDFAAAEPARRVAVARAAQVAAAELQWAREAATLRRVYHDLLKVSAVSRGRTT